MLSYTIFFMLNICFDSLLVSNEVKNVFPASGVYKNTKTRPNTDGFRKNNVNYWVFREIGNIILHL